MTVCERLRDKECISALGLLQPRVEVQKGNGSGHSGEESYFLGDHTLTKLSHKAFSTQHRKAHSAPPILQPQQLSPNFALSSDRLLQHLSLMLQTPL